ncbi:MAG: hypothetical protein K6E47_07765 [Lachnospiraceae bacterium]|nr:hypothetical protein [Lachnospiraceae bacterium]
MADATIMGLSTLGVTFGYGVETTAGQKPATFTQLHRINAIGGITVNPATIDASALEDYVTKTVAGRGETGGTWTVTVNFTDETEDEWSDLIAAYQTAKAAGKNMWFETIAPNLTKSFFVVAQPPEAIPMPEMAQNGLMTVEFPLVIVDPKGMDTKVAFT